VPVSLLILDSLGTSELLLILVVALIFFGPRKLPQLSRQIGKSLAEFRKASEDFKSTWAREVALDAEPQPDRSTWPHDDSNLGTTVERSETVATEAATPTALEITPESAIATSEAVSLSAASQPAQSEPTGKPDWL
jgi:Tat protein translocase TatB subunit